LMESFLSTPRANPRMICERMTPEFPRAPSNAPCDNALQIAEAECDGDGLASLMAACMVNNMFVPESPSGTGNTFKLLMYALCRSSQAVLAAKSCFSSCPPRDFNGGKGSFVGCSELASAKESPRKRDDNARRGEAFVQVIISIGHLGNGKISCNKK
jgi:hypothetical protein